MTCSTSTLTRTRGDDWTITGTISAGGAAVNLTGATVTSQLRRSVESATAVATFTVTVTDAVAGEVSLALADTVTEDIAPGRYVFDVQVVLSGVTTTYANDGTPWRLDVVGDVTR